ncbi:MAG TPA: zinc ribbon domain-containing protein [Actinopolymorphaceae bacterium]
MPRYDFRCRTCGETFEVTRSMSDADGPARCPSGHTDTSKLLSVVAFAGSSGAPAPAGGGGCCVGASGCG